MINMTRIMKQLLPHKNVYIMEDLQFCIMEGDGINILCTVSGCMNSTTSLQGCTYQVRHCYTHLTCAANHEAL